MCSPNSPFFSPFFPLFPFDFLTFFFSPRPTGVGAWLLMAPTPHNARHEAGEARGNGTWEPARLDLYPIKLDLYPVKLDLYPIKLFLASAGRSTDLVSCFHGVC